MHCSKALNQIHPLVRGDHGDVDHANYTCQRSLESFQRSLSSRLSGSAGEGSAAPTWFELGLEVAAGYWDDPQDVPPGRPPKDGVARWVPDHPERIERLLRQLGLSLSEVLSRGLPVDTSIWSDDLPRFLAGWDHIELGLRRLLRLQGRKVPADGPFEPSKEEQRILDALNHRELSKRQLARAAEVPERSLHDRGPARPGLLSRLIGQELVAKRPGSQGRYYRPDAPRR